MRIVEWIVEGNYGQGWEEVTAEESRAEAIQRRREYDENEPQYPHRIRLQAVQGVDHA